jgi:hypothetical protein
MLDSFESRAARYRGESAEANHDFVTVASNRNDVSDKRLI